MAAKHNDEIARYKRPKSKSDSKLPATLTKIEPGDTVTWTGREPSGAQKVFRGKVYGYAGNGMMAVYPVGNAHGCTVNVLASRLRLVAKYDEAR